MRSSMQKFLAAVAVMVGASLPAIVHADAITAQLTGLTPYTFGTVYLQGAGDLGGSGVGSIQWQGVSTNLAPFNGPFTTYCIDLLQDINFNNTYSFTLGSLQDAPNVNAYPAGGPTTGMGSAKATEIDTLFGMHFADTIDSSINQEAFQLAIWNIVYDTDDSVSQGSGTFYAINNSGLDAAAITEANAFLADASNAGNQSQFAVHDVIALFGQDGAQDQLFLDPLLPAHITVAGAPFPAAGTSAAVLMGLIGIARWKRHARLQRLQM